MNRCGHCGKFFSWAGYDSYVPWGCADPEYPEPYDPVFICAACSERQRDKLVVAFLERGLSPGRRDWIPSRAEREARVLARAAWRLHGRRPVIHQRARERLRSGEHEIACTCGWLSRHALDDCHPSRWLCRREDEHRDSLAAATQEKTE